MHAIKYTVNDDQPYWGFFLAGSQKAFATLYESYFDLLYEYGMRFYYDSEIVKDCIQDLFVKLWVNRAHLSVTTAVKPYLFTALRNAILNKLDQEKHAKNREEKAAGDISFEMHYNIEDDIISHDEAGGRNARIRQALEQLTARQKECIYLRFYAGLEYAEIADMMGISLKASYKIVGRAISFLREYFKEVSLYVIIWALIFLPTLLGS